MLPIANGMRSWSDCAAICSRPERSVAKRFLGSSTRAVSNIDTGARHLRFCSSSSASVRSLRSFSQSFGSRRPENEADRKEALRRLLPAAVSSSGYWTAMLPSRRLPLLL